MTAETQPAEPFRGKIRGKDVARYIFLPEIMPRVKALGGSGFGYLAFLIASVYQAVRILPAGHPYTRAANIGKFGIRQVIAAAADNIQFNRKNIDQIIIFFAVIAALILLVFQFIGLVFLLFSGEAFAQATGGAATGSGFAGIFKTTAPEKDIAFMLLDHVFGVPSFFGSEVLQGGQTPFHLALQAMFKFYNLAILIVAVLIFLYFVMVVVAETALTGTPFGKRFNSIYAPLRLVFAVGLLVPLNYGLNGSQYITLAAARAGSGMATNGWILFNKNLTNPLGAENKTFVAEPKPPENANLDQFMTVVHACRMAYEMQYNITIDAFVVFGELQVKYNALDYQTALRVGKGGDIEVIYGEAGESDDHKKFAGQVIPYCGKINIPMTIRNPASLSGGGTGGTGGGAGGGGSGGSIGPEKIQEAYYKIAQFIWVRPLVKALGERMAYALTPSSRNNPCHESGLLEDASSCQTPFKPPSAIKSQIVESTKSILAADVKIGVDTARSSVDLKISEDVLKRGWGGAGIWYNQIAELNGALVDASQSFPAVSRWPLLLEYIEEKKRGQDGKTEPCNRFQPNLAENKPVTFPGGAGDQYIASAMNSAYRYWYCDNTTEAKGFTANAIWDAMHVIFGTNGLFALRENSADEVHPLAQLSAIGKSLVESSIRNMGYSMGTAVAGGFFGAIAPHWGAPLQAMSKFFVSVAMIGLVAGFILFYILPFLPFIYFFFAVGSWVKTIFEAMVGAPLWALAHLRIDGDGFPARAAANGYFLIFEIFVRPILTVFGLLGGMAIFTAMAVILNDLFDFVVFQVTGTELTSGGTGTGGTGGSVYTGEYEDFRRAIVDEFFFTVLYAVILYMMGLSSFKMIDLVPNNILRWMGAGVSSFGDQSGDPKEGLVQYAAIGGYTVGGQIVGSMNQLGGAAGTAAGGLLALGQNKGGDKG